MKTLQSIKMLIRSPIRTAFVFLLLGTVTFALLSQTLEYAILRREINSAKEQYRGVGYVEASPPISHDSELSGTDAPFHLSLESTATEQYELLTQEQMDAVSNLPYITYADRRYMTTGISPKINRLDDGEYFFNFSNRCIVAGTVLPETSDTGFGTMDIYLNDIDLLAGYVPGLVVNDSGTMIRLGAFSSNYGEPGVVSAAGVFGTHRTSSIFIGGPICGA